MAELATNANGTPGEWKQHPFRRAVLSGLGVVLPPLLTIVIFVWVWNTIQDYVLIPVETGTRNMIGWCISDIRDERPPEAMPAEPQLRAHIDKPMFKLGDQYYVQVAGEQWLPLNIYEAVVASPGDQMPTTADGIYRRYVDNRYLRRFLVIPLFLSVFVLFLYLLGKFLAAGIGRILWNFVEQLIHRVPVIRNVYGSVKQVTDFVFTEQEFEYTRGVAVEYPRKGIWSLGFVTGESMLDIRSAANEPVLSVLIPTSPMPATGFAVTLRKSETIDLNITVDQAIQFIVSCGVVVPFEQLHQESDVEASATDTKRLAAMTPGGVTAATVNPQGEESDDGGTSTGLDLSDVPGRAVLPSEQAEDSMPH